MVEATTRTPRLPPLSAVIARHGLSPRRRLGQHYLLDPAITARIAVAAGDLTGVEVLEVGPGPGGLTRALLGAGVRRVVCVERDARFVPALVELEEAFPGRVTIVKADAQEIDEAALLQPHARIIANLPYNVATPLLFKWLPILHRFESLTLMFQKEVAARLLAKSGTQSYGRLSVMGQWYCDARRAFDIRPGAFMPPPKVVSTVVVLTPRPVPVAHADAAALQAVVAAAFGQRRKMLRSSLRSLGLEPLPLLEAAGITPTVRAEELTIEEFCALARAYAGSARSGVVIDPRVVG